MSHCTKPKCKNMVELNSIFKRCDHCREFVSKSTKKYRDNHPEIRLKNNEYYWVEIPILAILTFGDLDDVVAHVVKEEICVSYRKPGLVFSSLLF